MRLICPNCAAQYEVPDDVIPDAGRDVQCSNCGQTWFEYRGQTAEPEPEPIAAPAAADPVEDATGEEASEAETAPPRTSESEVAAAPRRRSLDPAVADVLREERATSTALRRPRQPDPMESQGDLALDTPPRSVRPAAAPPADQRPPRKDSLPDIDEINSTLRPADEPAQDPTDTRTAAEKTAQTHRRGFRIGFGVVLLVAAAATGVYHFAPRIAETVPATGPALLAYVDNVDAARLWLDLNLQGIIDGMYDADDTPAE
ncbi:zinc-ribbon domain-containing protein [Roseisalinus antarcticus]|uniref:Zinc finger/thioredoxin putative domain-containing protein n=1 Tax=Roseisalinus antarcticus TaxID=254357 RepID=A0A1Y5RSL5_9RHOB|nr:zinc-ribbon domain-containing protein [Roseisalinus antarcticus]SLN21768.1 hypothetical protein ROA7023_00590 [Roseisalinus antarcticus]